MALSSELERRLFYIAVGGFTISITFIKEVIGSNEPVATQFLNVSWLLFLASLVISMGNHYIGGLSYREYIHAHQNGSDPEKKYDQMIEWLTIVTVLLVTAGMVFLALFSMKNL